METETTTCRHAGERVSRPEAYLRHPEVIKDRGKAADGMLFSSCQATKFRPRVETTPGPPAKMPGSLFALPSRVQFQNIRPKAPPSLASREAHIPFGADSSPAVVPT